MREESELRTHREFKMQQESLGSNTKLNVHIPQPKRYNSNNKLHKKQSRRNTQFKSQEKQQKSIGKSKTSKIRQANEQQIKINKSAEQGVGQVLSYLFYEHRNFQNLRHTSQLSDWQVHQVSEQGKDTQLGDFIIKMPNPDNLPAQYEQKYPKLKQSSYVMMINLQKALSYYKEMFEIEESLSFNADQIEEAAFILGFYFLNLKNKQIEEFNSYVQQFMNIYEYYIFIYKKSLTDYLKSRKQKKLQKLYERIPFLMQQKINGILEKKQSIALIQKKYKDFKDNIYKYLEKEVKSQSIKSQKITSLFQNCPSISQFLTTFPCLMQSIINQCTNYETQLRKYCKGQTISKKVLRSQLVWSSRTKYPRDVMTLLRRMLQYRLTIRGNLFIRSFLSKDEKYIFLVAKTSQAVMEIHAQKIKMNMEVELGSTDLFSFEPVDHYCRPLRTHPYIRDPEFIKKYNLNTKQDKDNHEDLKSIESQALNYFKKAQNMNVDQLRAKIILDQEDSDKLYKWMSQVLDIEYIDHHDILYNSYNNEEISKITWESYYLYNKLIIQFIKRAQILYKTYPDVIENNIGMLLRLMFLKALYISNNTYAKHRQEKGVIPNSVKNLFKGDKILTNLWDHLKIEVPTGFWSYIKKAKERVWKKYEVNQLKDRSKFFPSERVIITNKVIQRFLSKSQSINGLHICDFYPLHDPYILKGIHLEPYLLAIKKLKAQEPNKKLQSYKLNLGQLLSQYECPYTASDFTKASVEQRLSFKPTKMTQFSLETVRYYCGQKLALYFQFTRFLSVKAFPVTIIAFFFQIFLWVQKSHILKTGSSQLTLFNNVLIFIFTIINIIWTTNAVEKWKSEEVKFGQLFGVSNLNEEDQKRATFSGSYKRNFSTDQMNYQYVPLWKTVLKAQFTFILILCYVVFVFLLIMLIFSLKSFLFQKGFSQNMVNLVPSILISITVQACNYFFTILMNSIAEFENHKTLSSYESSLVSKSYLVTFVLRFYSIFIYAFFAKNLQVEFICRLKTSLNTIVYNCDYFVSDQLLSLVIVDLFTSILAAFIPFLIFKIKEFLRKGPKQDVKMAPSIFQAIDEFYEEEDQMQTYMYNHQIDRSWQGYLGIISKFTALALFGPVLPFSYCMMYIGGIVGLHSGKYQIIFLSRRSIPIKANSINIWLIIMELISLSSIVINLMYMIYTRNVFAKNQAQIFFFLVIIFIVFKYYLKTQYTNDDDRMGKRNRLKIQKLLLGKGKDSINNIPEIVNTDIQNVIYDQKILCRSFPKIAKANVKPQKFKSQ